MNYRFRLCKHALAMSLLLTSSVVFSDTNSRLIATGGAMSLEGAAGGGIVPWAMLAGYAESDEIGGSAWVTRVNPDDFDFTAFGAAATIHNRFELSIAQQSLDIDSVVPGETLKQDIMGLKVRLAGDIVYTPYPQFSLGAQYKKNTTYSIPSAVGAARKTGVDVYLAASKLWLDGPFHRTVFANSTVRATKANQMGLLGFGGDTKNKYQLQLEVSAGLFFNRHWVLGAEYRQKPDNLNFTDEDDWYDVFVGWFPNKHVSVVAAWSELGTIAGKEDQSSVYLSLQVSR